MRKGFTVFLLTALLTGLLITAAAADYHVSDIAVDVALREDGSARITQEFSAVTDEGTEFYLDYLDSGCLTITDFQVSDENGPYEVLDEGAWDIDASFEEKACKCGMLPIDGGVELCWGITQYGPHRYTVTYVLHDLVGSYSDADGFNYRFINADMGFFPTDAVVTIRCENGTPLRDETCDIWSFGHEGQIRFEDGAIRAWTESPLEGGANMTIMVELQKGVLTPARTEKDSFETVREQAFQDSDYGDDSTDFWGTVVILAIVAAVVTGSILICTAAAKARRKKWMNRTDYFREVPNGGNLNVSFVLGKGLEFCPEDSLMGARLLRLITLGSLEPVSSVQDEEDVSLRLTGKVPQGDGYDEALYAFLQEAAGEDGVLQPRELEKFCDDTDRAAALSAIMDRCEQDGKLALVRGGCLKGAVCDNFKDLTAQGKRELSELVGLKRYLLDFSLLSERNVSETFLWQEYMVYAMLLGIAKQVVSQLEALYPGNLPQLRQYDRYIRCSYGYDYLLFGAVNRQRQDAQAEQAARTGGSGGIASFGGGGGFLGGGGGGIR